MAHTANRNGVLIVDLSFEGEKREHQVNSARYLMNTFLSIGPDTGAHIVDGLHAKIMKLALESQIKIGGVDSNKDIHFPRDHKLSKRFFEPKKLRQPAERLNKPHYSQSIHRRDALTAFAEHLWAANAYEVSVRKA